MADQKHRIRLSVEGAAKLDGMRRDVEGTFARIDSAASKLGAVIAGVAGTGGLALLVKGQVDAARQARAWSDALDIPIAKLTAMQVASKVVGFDADKMANILKDSSEKIADAYRNGGGEAVEVLDSLGLSVERINSLAPDQQLFAIADALGEVNTHGEKVQIMESLASDAALLLPLLDNNAEKMRDLMRLSDETGATLTGLEADELIRAGEAMSRLSQSAQGLGQTLAIHLAGPIANVIDQLNIGIPNAINWASKQINSLQISNVTNRLESAESRLNKLRKERNDLEERHKDILESGVFKVSELEEIKGEIEGYVALVDRLNAELDELRNPATVALTVRGASSGGGDQGAAERQRLQAGLDALQTSLASEEQAILNSYLTRQETINDAERMKLDTLVGYDELRKQSFERYEAEMTEIAGREAARRGQIEQQVQNQISGLRMTGVNIAVGMLRNLGQEHEGAAYAAIALEKAIAIAQIETSTAAALAAANTLYALGPAGPAAVKAAQADILSTATFSKAMVVASGLLEASQVGSGGGGAGGAGGAIPVTPVQSPTDLSPLGGLAAPQQGNQLVIVIKGEGPFDDMVRNSIEAQLNNDEIMVIHG